MNTTRPATLVVAVLAAAALAWLGIDRFYGSMPDLPWLPPLTMLGLAAVEGATAVQTRARIERRKGAGPVQPLLVARYVVLAKASALAGALFGGLYLGLTGWLAARIGDNTHAQTDMPAAVTGVVGAFALMAGGLWLERACRVPPPPPGSDPSSLGRNGTEGSRDDHVDGGRAGS